MPVEEITPAQRQWATRFLEFIGGNGASGDGDGLGAEREEAIPIAGKRRKGREDAYGEGYKGGLAPDTRALPTQALKDAVDATKPAKMLSVDEWKAVVTARKLSATEVNGFLADKNTIRTKLDEWEAKQETLQKVLRAYGKLNTAKNANAATVDLRPDVNEPPIAFAQMAAKLNVLANEYRAAKAEVDKVSAEAAKCLPVFDAPENNPECAVIEQKLKGLAEVEAEFPPPIETGKRAAYAKKKGQALLALQGTVFEWNDRRTQQNLPPSADAIAMSDIVQRAHQDLTKLVVDNDLPLPLSEEQENTLSDEEKVKLQATWKNIAKSETEGAKAGSRVMVTKPAIDGKFIKTDADAEQFKLETLSNFGRLMQSEAGRHTVDRINSGTHTVKVQPSDSAECARGATAGEAQAWDKAKTKGTGTGSRVGMVLGARDSSVALNTKNGNVLSGARFIAMGHELIHALHNSKGVNRREAKADGLTADRVVQKWDTLGTDEQSTWSNPEELQTIINGSLSEQTLRSQFGLSAERFGHGQTIAKQSVVDAFKETVATTEKIEQLKTEGKDLDDALTKRGFVVAGLTPKTRLAIYEAPTDVKGPLPAGWDGNKLTVAQIKGIVGPPPIPAKLGELGWAPFGLTPVRMKEIIDHREHHERSAKGRRFKTLGGADALTKFDGLKADTGIDLAKPTDAKWESQFTALEAADKALTTLGTTHSHDDIKKAAAGKGQVGRRIEKVKLAWKKVDGEYLALGGDAALGEIDGYNTAFGKTLDKTATDLFTKLAALKGAEVELTSLKNSTTSAEVKSAIGTGTVGAQLKAVTDIWTKLKADLVTLGGDKGLAAIDDVNLLAKTSLGKGSAELPTKVAAIRAAEAELTKLANTKNDPELKTIAAAKRPLDVKVDLFTKAHTRLAQAEMSAQGQDTARQEVETKAGAIHTAFSGGEVTRIMNDANAAKSRLKKVTDAMKSASEVIDKLPGTFALLAPAFHDVENEASAYLNHKDHQNPKTSDGKARVAECRTMLKAAQDAKGHLKEIAEKALAAVEFAEALAKKPDDFHESALTPLAGLHSNRYVAPDLRKRLGDAMLTARTDGTLKQQERANALTI